MRSPRDPANGVADAAVSDDHFKVEDGTTEIDNEDAISSSDVQPSFKGRLNLTDFAFAHEASIKREFSANSRRSPRILVQGGSVAATLPLKRKPSTPTGRNSVSPARRSRKPGGYAAPSTYAHLKPLPDVITPNPSKGTPTRTLQTYSGSSSTAAAVRLDAANRQKTRIYQDFLH
jgi:hypothetical protein